MALVDAIQRVFRRQKPVMDPAGTNCFAAVRLDGLLMGAVLGGAARW
jgi:hypothetical protein